MLRRVARKINCTRAGARVSERFDGPRHADIQETMHYPFAPRHSQATRNQRGGDISRGLIVSHAPSQRSLGMKTGSAILVCACLFGAVIAGTNNHVGIMTYQKLLL